MNNHVKTIIEILNYTNVDIWSSCWSNERRVQKPKPFSFIYKHDAIRSHCKILSLFSRVNCLCIHSGFSPVQQIISNSITRRSEHEPTSTDRVLL